MERINNGPAKTPIINLAIKHEQQNIGQIHEILEILGIENFDINYHVKNKFGWISYDKERKEYISFYLSPSWKDNCENSEIDYEAFIKLYG